MPYLEGIWDRKVLTNNGPLHQELEAALCDYLGVPEIALFNNGTIALLTALQSLDLKGEIITTPYSFVATSHSLLWNGSTPVFVDIDPTTYNIDPLKVEAAITANTRAIVAVHCYGNPCHHDALEALANRYSLKIIYDAAHAFGVKDQSGSILNHGDLAAVSFHATKVFNTFEGGAIVCADKETKQRINNLKNFGIVNEVSVVDPGINGKMSEINAALGLLQLKYADQIFEQRQSVDQRYRQGFSDLASIVLPPQLDGVTSNYSYFPILVTDAYPLKRDELYEHLKQHGVYSRRYFYPLITTFPMYHSLPSAHPVNLPVAHHVADRILCLPIYPSMTDADITRVIELVRR